MDEDATKENSVKDDPIVIKVEETLSSLMHDKSYRLCNKGYIIKRFKGEGVSGFFCE
jgi:hypothetical protein